MSDLDSLLIFGGFVAVIMAFVAIASARDPNIRRKVSIVTKSGTIESVWVTKKNLIRENGALWYVFRDGRYLAAGPQYQFTYRLARSFGLRKYIGVQRIYLEGNPSPYTFAEDTRMAMLRDTARLLGNAADSDLAMKLLRPRKVDLVLLILIGAVAFFIGFSVGGTT